MASATWHGPNQHHAASSTADDDFNQFLNLNDMGTMAESLSFNFHGFSDGSSQSPTNQQQQHQPQPQPPPQQQQQPDTIMGDADMLQAHSPPSSMRTSGGMPTQLLTAPAPSDVISSLDAQIQYLQQQKFHQQQRQLHEQQTTFFSHHHSVPPTPRSLELPPSGGQFYSQTEQTAQRTTFDRGYHQRLPEQQDMAFTPLVSPAVTPLDPHFNPENAFTVPAAAYFSPLTSPALHAQTDSSSVYDYSTRSNNSPVEVDLDAAGVALTGPSGNDLSKKARKNNAVKARGGRSGVKHSPITKPQRRKTGPSPAIVSQVLSEMDERKVPDQGLLPLPATSTDGSEENASVSPENLAEMPPPPVPARRSTSGSPYFQAQSSSSQQPTPRSSAEEPGQQKQEQQLTHPATPASLMKLPASKATRPLASSREQHSVAENIESLELPESISNRQLVPIQTSVLVTSPRTEPSPARGQPQQALASPAFRNQATSSTSLSPPLQTQRGPSGPVARRTPQMSSKSGGGGSSSGSCSSSSGGGGRKRSTSSIHASPALLPRISPNIKPLLPSASGMSAEDTASRLLMTKSNYQNILEGNTVPGISYPTELSTNLTSKRTSHKIAEQGRRNRINTALQIIASLLPEQQNLEECDEAEKKEGKSQGNVPNSKASVVENAIVHMKVLQQENVDLKQQLQDLRSQMEKLRGNHDDDTKRDDERR